MATSGSLWDNKYFKLCLPMAVYLFFIVFPTPTGLSVEGWRAVALVISGIVAFSVQPISTPILVPLFVLCAVPLGICKLGEAISNFMGPAFIFVFAMICIALAFEKSGLTKRIALTVVSMSGGRPKKLIFLFTATATLASTILADIPVMAMLIPVAQKIIESNGCNVRGSNFAQALLLAVASGSCIGGIGTPAGSAANPVSIQIFHEFSGQTISFLQWSMVGVPAAIALIPVTWFFLTFFLPSEIKHLKGLEELKKEKEALGPMTRKEIAFLLIIFFTLIAWLTDTAHGLPVQVTSMFSIALLSMPGVEIFDWKTDRANVNWEAIMLVGGATAFGFFFIKTGVTTWFANEYLSALTRLPLIPLFACIGYLMIMMQFPMPAGVGAIATMAPAFLTIAQMKGINPAGMMMLVGLSTSGPLLSPATCMYPIANQSGLLILRNVWKTGFPITVVQLFIIMFCVFTIGGYMGFI